MFPVYNENGELIQFTVILKNASPELLEQLYKEVESRNINLMTTEMNKNGVVPLSVTGAGIIKFVQGACVDCNRKNYKVFTKFCFDCHVYTSLFCGNSGSNR